MRSRRLRAGLTQAELATRAGTSQATLSAYESGRKQPSVETLDRLLRAAGARLTAEPAEVTINPSRDELERAGRTLASVMELAQALPTRHADKLAFPRLL